MALRNIFSNNNKLSLEDFEVKSGLTLKEDNFEIKHQLNPTTGFYTVRNKLGNKLMEFDNNLNLKPSSLHLHIQNKYQEVKDITDTHNTRISNLEQVNDPFTYITGTTTSSIHNVVSIPISNNTLYIIKGKIMFLVGYIEFVVDLKNISNTLTINSWNLDYFLTEGKSLYFEKSGQNVIIQLINISNGINYKLGYDLETMNI